MQNAPHEHASLIDSQRDALTVLSKRIQRDQQSPLLSFLDVVCCGFGAVVLLLVITKVQEPVITKGGGAELKTLIPVLERELFEVRSETSILKRELEPLLQETTKRVQRVDLMRLELAKAEDRYIAALENAAHQSDEADNLQAARQSLTEEMKRLLADYRLQPADTTVAGVAVDSEYLVFVIDSSGSMRKDAWRAVLGTLTDTLKVYPKIKGIQIMNADGAYLFPSSSGRWIPDSPTRRSLIIRALANWRDFSFSSPTQGIASAISTFYEESKKISIVVFGDDFQETSAESLIRYVERINKADRHGNRLVRINAVGFPTPGSLNPSGFANLMRVLCERNGGTFVALPSLN